MGCIRMLVSLLVCCFSGVRLVQQSHGFGKKKNQDYQFYGTVMWVKQYLLE
jgi:hypothetical protein